MSCSRITSWWYSSVLHCLVVASAPNHLAPQSCGKNHWIFLHHGTAIVPTEFDQNRNIIHHQKSWTGRRSWNKTCSPVQTVHLEHPRCFANIPAVASHNACQWFPLGHVNGSLFSLGYDAYARHLDNARNRRVCRNHHKRIFMQNDLATNLLSLVANPLWANMCTLKHTISQPWIHDCLWWTKGGQENREVSFHPPKKRCKAYSQLDSKQIG